MESSADFRKYVFLQLFTVWFRKNFLLTSKFTPTGKATYVIPHLVNKSVLACGSDMMKMIEPEVPHAVAEYHCDGTGTLTYSLLYYADLHTL